MQSLGSIYLTLYVSGVQPSRGEDRVRACENSTFTRMANRSNSRTDALITRTAIRAMNNDYHIDGSSGNDVSDKASSTKVKNDVDPLNMSPSCLRDLTFGSLS